MVALEAAEDVCAYYQSLPVDYVNDGRLGSQHYFLTTLEYGSSHSHDPFGATRVHRDNASVAHMSQFLHPVVRQYVRGVKVSEHHVIEDLAAEWKEPVHTQPLLSYLRRTLCAHPQGRVRTPRADAARFAARVLGSGTNPVVGT